MLDRALPLRGAECLLSALFFLLEEVLSPFELEARPEHFVVCGKTFTAATWMDQLLCEEHEERSSLGTLGDRSHQEQAPRVQAGTAYGASPLRPGKLNRAAHKLWMAWDMLPRYQEKQREPSRLLNLAALQVCEQLPRHPCLPLLSGETLGLPGTTRVEHADWDWNRWARPPGQNPLVWAAWVKGHGGSQDADVSACSPLGPPELLEWYTFVPDHRSYHKRSSGLPT
ncbi:hypothetical protein NDU88_003801 [Pleurodeles waltl]|uniref:Uncharacterized protein n=1 Tax=Pleurodeles waltl TaxID=8319 RepID=A0AAV7TQS3_PLEWA|nr:hypothetical protein NDU88_003801 [Pleurodeles waltl]